MNPELEFQSNSRDARNGSDHQGQMNVPAATAIRASSSLPSRRQHGSNSESTQSVFSFSISTDGVDLSPFSGIAPIASSSSSSISSASSSYQSSTGVLFDIAENGVSILAGGNAGDRGNNSNNDAVAIENANSDDDEHNNSNNNDNNNNNNQEEAGTSPMTATILSAVNNLAKNCSPFLLLLIFHLFFSILFQLSCVLLFSAGIFALEDCIRDALAKTDGTNSDGTVGKSLGRYLKISLSCMLLVYYVWLISGKGTNELLRYLSLESLDESVNSNAATRHEVSLGQIFWQVVCPDLLVRYFSIVCRLLLWFVLSSDLSLCYSAVAEWAQCFKGRIAQFCLRFSRMAPWMGSIHLFLSNGYRNPHHQSLSQGDDEGGSLLSSSSSSADYHVHNSPRDSGAISRTGLHREIAGVSQRANIVVDLDEDRESSINAMRMEEGTVGSIGRRNISRRRDRGGGSSSGRISSERASSRVAADYYRDEGEGRDREHRDGNGYGRGIGRNIGRMARSIASNAQSVFASWFAMNNSEVRSSNNSSSSSSISGSISNASTHRHREALGSSLSANGNSEDEDLRSELAQLSEADRQMALNLIEDIEKIDSAAASATRPSDGDSYHSQQSSNSSEEGHLSQGSYVSNSSAYLRMYDRSERIRQKRAFSILDVGFYIYRELLPISLWMTYFSSRLHVFDMAYLLLKIFQLWQHSSALLELMKSVLMRELEFGREVTDAEQNSGLFSGDCAICFDSMHQPVVLPCQHTFCQQCIYEWLDRGGASQSDPTCPVCRAVVPSSMQHYMKIKAKVNSALPVFM